MLASVPSRRYRTRLWPMFISRPVSRGSVGVWSSPRLVVSRSVPTMPSWRAQAMPGHHLLVVVLAGGGGMTCWGGAGGGGGGADPPGSNRKKRGLETGEVWV
jgi:hypothetical protein